MVNGLTEEDVLADIPRAGYDQLTPVPPALGAEPTEEIPDVAQNVSTWTPQQPTQQPTRTWMSVANDYFSQAVDTAQRLPYTALGGLFDYNTVPVLDDISDYLDRQSMPAPVPPDQMLGRGQEPTAAEWQEYNRALGPRRSGGGSWAPEQPPVGFQFSDIPGNLAKVGRFAIGALGYTPPPTADEKAAAEAEFAQTAGSTRLSEADATRAFDVASGAVGAGLKLPGRGLFGSAASKADDALDLAFGGAKPPPPTSGAQAADESGGALSTLLAKIQEAKPLEAQNQELLHQFRQRQSGAFHGAFQPGSGEAGFKSGMAAMRGQAERVTFTPLRDALQQSDVDAFIDTIGRSPLSTFQRANAGSALLNILDGQVPVPSELAQLERVFPGLRKALQDANIIKGPGIKDYVKDILGAATSIPSSYDISGLRQVATTAAGHPVQFSRDFRRSLNALKSDDALKAIDDELANRWYAPLRESAGVAKADAERGLHPGESTFIADWVNKLPGYRASQRQYAALLNLTRDSLFSSMLRGYGGTIREIPDAELARWGKFVNIATGRGPLPGEIAANEILGQPLLWAPRLYSARVSFPFELLSSSRTVQKEAARQLISFVGVNYALLKMGEAAGVWEVEGNPTSADFGQIRIGPQRIDPWAGFRPFVNLAARLMTGERKSTTSGQITDAGWKELVGDFIRSKYSPVMSTAANVLEGKDAIGEPFGLKDVPGQFLPLFARDLKEAAENAGPLGLVGGLLGGVGFGVNTYEPTLTDTPWQQLPPDQQFKSIGAQAWRSVTGSQPQYERYGSYSRWYDAGYKTYFERAKAEGAPDAVAAKEALSQIRAHPVYKAMAKARDHYETEWIRANPQAALEFANEQTKLPERERWQPTNDQLDLLRELLGQPQ